MGSRNSFFSKAVAISCVWSVGWQTWRIEFRARKVREGAGGTIRGRGKLMKRGR